jgi:hypothetical protein
MLLGCHKDNLVGMGNAATTGPSVSVSVFSSNASLFVNGNDGSDPVGSDTGLGRVAAAANSVDAQMGN